MNQAVQIILYLGMAQGALLSVFLFSIKTNRISNRLLGLLTLFWGIIVGTFAFQYDDYHLNYPHLLKISLIFLFSLFPLLYLQVKYLLSRHLKFNPRDLFHFIPVLIVVLLNIGFYFKGGEEKLYMIRNESTYYYGLSFFQNELLALQGIIYSLMALIILSKYKQKIRDYQSNVDKAILKVQYLGILLSLIAWIIGIVASHIELFRVDFNLNLFIFVYLILVLIIYIISYTAIYSPEIFKLDENQIKLSLVKNKLPESEDNEKPTIYQTISNDQEKTDQIEKTNDKLLEFIEKEKPYLNPELTLQDLADSVGEKRYFLSIVINHKHSKNFYEFINQYRIEEVKNMITDPKNKHLKLISLAYDAGFNSKASFNRIFKQTTNMTPSQFISTQQAI